jgi:hypothetical protein
MLAANRFICPAPRQDGNPCGMRLADHPREENSNPAAAQVPVSLQILSH